MRGLPQASFRLLEPVVRVDASSRRETTAALRAARIRTIPEWYLAQTLVTSLAAGVLGALVTGVALAFLARGLPAWALVAFAVWGGVLVGAAVRLAFLLYPRIRAKSRQEAIEEEYQSAIMLCYALARGGMPAMQIFRTVSEEKETYGEICGEFEAIVRDVELFGHDTVKALQLAAGSTPSPLLRGFFEGLVSILNSGADPRDYFKRQAEQQLARAETQMEEQLQRADMLAEIYVSSFLVLPLLVLVVLSGLSALGNGQERYIPAIVYGLIPAGTVFYVVALEVMMPSAKIRGSKGAAGALADFGMASLRADEVARAAAAPPTAGKLPLAMRLRERSARLKQELLAKPVDALNLSLPVALVVLVAGVATLWLSGADAYRWQYHGLVLLLVAVGIAVAPIAILHEIRLGYAQRIEGALPDMLGKLAGFNERGIGLLQSFQILARSSTGPLAKEMRTLDRDVHVNGNLQGAIRRLRERVRTLRMAKLSVLIERASRSTSSLKDVLDIAALDETRTQSLVSRKRQTMMSYVIVIYIVFAVFLYVAFMTTSLFYSGADFEVAGSAGAPVMGSSLDPRQADILFLHAVVLQGVGCGIVAGRLGHGYTLSGVKHAVALGGLALVVFAMGVM